MVIVGYTGVNRNEQDDAKRRLWLLKKMKNSKSYYDSFMSFDENSKAIPINYFPLQGLGHDSAAAIMRNGKVLSCVAEERFNRKKHSLTIDEKILMPKQSLDYCFKTAGLKPEQVDYVCHYMNMSEDMFEKRLKILSEVLPSKIKDQVLVSNQLSYEKEFSHDTVYEELKRFTNFNWPIEKLKFVPHHLAHAASAYYSSGMEDAGILTLDGYGEKDSSIFALGKQNRIELVEETSIPDSLGIFYMIITVFLGFRALNDEYKVMGLASYGNPKTYKNQFEKLIKINDDGSYDTKILVSENLRGHLIEFFGSNLEEGSNVTQRKMDIAAALQNRVEEAILHRLAMLKKKYGFENLCMAGGMSLNCAMNGRIARSNLFKNIYIFPAAGDDGCSLGAAQYVYFNVLNGESKKKTTKIKNVYLGPQFSDIDVASTLNSHSSKLNYTKSSCVENEVAEFILDQKVIGWFQGKMEFGPRSLGNRSILGDARNPEMKDIINKKIKWRETFRPFAPATKYEKAASYFDMGGLDESPFMLFVVPVLNSKQKVIPATTHHKGSARVQTVKVEDNPRFWALLDMLDQKSGVPVILNTSFNVKNEPIVCTPEDAIKCFLKTNIDVLVIHDYIIFKNKE